MDYAFDVKSKNTLTKPQAMEILSCVDIWKARSFTFYT